MTSFAHFIRQLVAFSCVIASIVVAGARELPASPARESRSALQPDKPRTDAWLGGSAFTGILPPRGDRDAMVVHITAFQGAHIDAFTFTMDAGWIHQTLHPRTLIGLEWLEYRCDLDPDCPARQYRIVQAYQDGSHNTMPAHSSNRDIWLYRVESRPVTRKVTARWHDICAPDHHGVTGGMFVDGRWGHDGTWTRGGYTFSCTRGVIAKCARSWGYKPWQQLTTGDGRVVDLQPLHQACVRAARADYCGDGVSYTRNGTLIDIRDIYGFNVLEPIAGFRQEAGFDQRGALWIDHKRWPTPTRDTAERVHLPTCSRPRSAPDQGSGTALLHVWSAENR